MANPQHETPETDRSSLARGNDRLAHRKGRARARAGTFTGLYRLRNAAKSASGEGRKPAAPTTPYPVLEGVAAQLKDRVGEWRCGLGSTVKALRMGPATTDGVAASRT